MAGNELECTCMATEAEQQVNRKMGQSPPNSG